MAQDKVTMPMTSAGIIGFSPDMKISGFEIDPKMFVGAAMVAVLLIKVVGVLVS
jgi:preprotein translocase subunit Sec61beta